MIIKDLIKGDYSREILKKYFTPLLIINFCIWMIISSLFYNNYDWTRMDVSYLGVPALNPNGWVFWAIAMASTGVLTIPIVNHLKKNLTNLNKKSMYLVSIFFYIASYGMIGLGVVPVLDGTGFLYIHFLHAAMAFCGLYLGIWILLLLMLKDENMRKKTIIPLIITWGIIIGFIISQTVRLSQGLPPRDSFWYLNTSAWEWMILATIFSAILVLIYSLEID